MIQLQGQVQKYAWGSPDAIPRLLGTEPTGEPHAEYWLGAHEAAPSHAGGDTLDLLIAAKPALLGEESLAAFGPRLPFLMKVLAAEQPLSIQAHPDREQAEAGFARETAENAEFPGRERTYRDTWPKPECMVALADSDVLCGFREPRDTLGLFAALDPSAELAALLSPLASRGGAAGVAETFLDVLSLDETARDVVNEVVVAAAAHQRDGGPLGVFASTAIELDGYFPADKGILAALLMNRHTLRPGQAIFLAPGNMHAYLRGLGIEVMANSDNVLRGGLTSKHIDVQELVRVVDFTPGEVPLVATVEEAPGVIRYATPAPEFALWRLDVAGLPVTLPANHVARILLLTEGAARLTSGGMHMDLAQGDSAFLAAGEEASLDGSATAFLSGAGV